jgi:hypothetical protein
MGGVIFQSAKRMVFIYQKAYNGIYIYNGHVMEYNGVNPRPVTLHSPFLKLYSLGAG